MIEKILNKLFKHRIIINCDKDPYLKRWYLIRLPRVALFLHKFIRSDEDRALHDHPWDFIVIPIWRGYYEYNDSGRIRVWPFWNTAHRYATYRHRVELIAEQPSWSLFIRFEREREWGFWPEHGFVNWKQWWSDMCED